MSMFYCFFFFKQKTAYEMRISDWSSDVCSSDLPSAAISSAADPAAATIAPPTAGPTLRAMLKPMELNVTAPRSRGLGTKRSEERREGKEWVRPCRSRWSPYHEQNKTHNTKD